MAAGFAAGVAVHLALTPVHFSERIIYGSSCCGSSAALFLGVSTTVALFRVTAWILNATVGMLAFNPGAP